MNFSRTRGNIQIQPTIRRNQSSVPQEVPHRCYEFWRNHRPTRIIDLQPEYIHIESTQSWLTIQPTILDRTLKRGRALDLRASSVDVQESVRCLVGRIVPRETSIKTVK